MHAPHGRGEEQSGEQVVLEERDRQHRHRDDRHHSRGEAVEAVDQIDRVGHAHDPDHRQDGSPHPEIEVPAPRQADHRKRPAGPDQGHRGHHLDQELLQARDPLQVVDQARQEDHQQAEREGDQLRPPDLKSPGRPLRHRHRPGAERQADEDRDAAQSRHDAGVAPPLPRLVERAQGLGQAHHRRHEQARHQAGGDRGERGGEKNLGHEPL